MWRRVDDGVETVVRVRRPVPWWRTLRGRPDPTDPDAMLGWLLADAVAPTIAEASGGYGDLLAELYEVQALLVGLSSSGREPTQDERCEAIRALRAVRASPHAVRLPPQTYRSVRWYLARLEGS